MGKAPDVGGRPLSQVSKEWAGDCNPTKESSLPRELQAGLSPGSGHTRESLFVADKEIPGNDFPKPLLPE